MKRSKILLSAVLAGLCVGFGGIVFLSVDNKVIGSAAFTIGLFVICTFGFHLFTGKVCYVLQNDRNYALDLPVIWLGNLIGTGLTAGCAALTARCALESASMNVFVNTRMLPDCTEAQTLHTKAWAMLEEYLPRAQAVSNSVMDHLRTPK